MSYEEFQSKLQQHYPGATFDFSTDYDDELEELVYYALSPDICISWCETQHYTINTKELP